MELDPEVVYSTFLDCLSDEGFDPDDLTDEIDMITACMKFDKNKIAAHAELIVAMLLELPTEFRQSEGGGWSFLQACMDRHGNQWTGLHERMAMLFALGQATTPPLVSCQLPRDMWDVLPGGMPYYAINDQSNVRQG